MTFKTGRKNEKQSLISYIVHSSKTPQQTSLLGMMRFLLLSNEPELFDIKENHIISDKDNMVKKLIGGQGFRVDNEENCYGAIKSVGACYVCKRTGNGQIKFYYKSPLDHSLTLNHKDVTTAYINDMLVSIPSISVAGKEKKLYNGKHYVESCYICTTDVNDFWEENTVFIEDSRIGIDKDYEGKPQKSAFYKQISYRLKAGYSFAFDVELDGVDSQKLGSYNGQLIQLGGDSSNFILNIEEGEIPSVVCGDEGKVLLVSDSFIPKEALEHVSFAITRIRPFRFLETVNKNNSNYYNVRTKSLKSKRYDLYEAGSVFFVKNKVQFKTIVERENNFYKIGYNHCI